MAATYVSKGYGQVEPNRLTAMIDGHFESQAPAYTDTAFDTPIPELENGMFLCLVPDLTGATPMGRALVLPGQAAASAPAQLVFSERKVYDERHTNCDFVDKAADKRDGTLYPRTFQITLDNDTYTTNTIDAAAGSLEVGDVLYVGDNGYLSETKGVNTSLEFVVVKVYTMPDGQPGVKVLARPFGATV